MVLRSARSTLAARAAAAAAVFVLAACSPASPAATTQPGASAATSSAPSASAEASAEATAAASLAESTAVPTAIDPCQLVTAAEASAIAGASFGTGTESTTSGGAKSCVYGGQTQNVFSVVVAVAPDAATAQADWAQEQSQAQANLQKEAPAGMSISFNVSDTSNVAGADRAAVATASTTFSGVTIGISGIYVLKGSVFFSFSDLALGHAGPATSAMEAQATTSVARLP